MVGLQTVEQESNPRPNGLGEPFDDSPEGELLWRIISKSGLVNTLAGERQERRLQLNGYDVDRELEIERKGDSRQSSEVSSEAPSAAAHPTKRIVSWETNDPENPYNWS